MLLASLMAAFVIQVQGDQGPPRTPPPPRKSVEEMLQHLRLRRDTLSPASGPAESNATPLSTAVSAFSSDQSPRGVAPPRRRLEDLLVELEKRPEERRVIDSLRRAGRIRNPSSPEPFDVEHVVEPAASEPGEGGAGDVTSGAPLLPQSTSLAVITPASPIVGMTADYRPTGAGPGLALHRIGPAVHRVDTRDYWALRVEYVCAWTAVPTTSLGAASPQVYTTSVVDAQKYPPARSLTPTVAPNWNQGARPAGTFALTNEGEPCSTGNEKLPVVATIQPEITVAGVNLPAGTYVLNVRAWGRHKLAPPSTTEPMYGSAWGADGTSVKYTFGWVSPLTVIEAPAHGWYDYAALVSVGSTANLVHNWTFKVLGPVGVTLYVSEIALYKIG